MTKRELADILRLCGTTPDLIDCRAGCPFYEGPNPELCIPHMSRACADALGNAETHVVALQKEIEGLRDRLAQRWIPVTERLPEKWRESDGETLVNYMIFSPDFGVDVGNFHAKAQRWLCMGLPAAVTHWMPLPEPPKEDCLDAD